MLDFFITEDQKLALIDAHISKCYVETTVSNQLDFGELKGVILLQDNNVRLCFYKGREYFSDIELMPLISGKIKKACKNILLDLIQKHGGTKFDKIVISVTDRPATQEEVKDMLKNGHITEMPNEGEEACVPVVEYLYVKGGGAFTEKINLKDFIKYL